MTNKIFTTDTSKCKSKTDKGIVLAYSNGYRAINGFIVNGSKKVIAQTICSTTGYKRFCFVFGSRSDNTRYVYKIPTHRFVAYQKYSDKLFSMACVRHKNNNKLCNFEWNIALGSVRDNMMDVPQADRIMRASKAGRKYTNERIKEIRCFYANCKSYVKTMKEFNINSKGSLWYVLNNDYLSHV